MSYPSHSLPRPWFNRLRDSAVSQFFFALLCIGVPFVLSNLLVRLLLPEGADLSHVRNGIKVAVLLVAYLAYVRWVEKRPASELSLHGAAKEVGSGFLLGAAIISLSVALLAASGSYQVVGFNGDVRWLHYLAGFLAVAMLEELLFRAVLFRLLEKSLGSVIAIVISTGLFGLVHLLNPNAGWLSTASLTLISLIFVGSFLLTRRLWLCMGLHWSWNLFQALYSVSVSGIDTNGLLISKLTGPSWLTGGGFGVEASLLTLLLSVIAASYLLLQAYRKGQFVAPYWRARQSN